MGAVVSRTQMPEEGGVNSGSRCGTRSARHPIGARVGPQIHSDGVEPQERLNSVAGL